MTMYHETYHPFEGVLLDNLIFGMRADWKEIVLKQVQEANAAKKRNFRVTIEEPDKDGKGGIWFEVQNGIVISSCDLGQNR